MRIKVKELPFSEVLKINRPEHKNPKISVPFLRWLMKFCGKSDIEDTNFKANFIGMSKFPDEPCLILMNHSSFIDLKIVSNLLYPKPFAIVCTSDGFVGKEWLMRSLGCIPTNKFVPDATLISDISYALKTNKTHVLMYPEASYTFDGCATELPKRLGTVLRLLKTPVIMITTHGAFARDPLYNMLQNREVNVSADIEMLFTKEQLKEMTTEEVDEKLSSAFDIDNFKWQRDNKIEIDEQFRADGLERILYTCPYCGAEGKNKGKGTRLTCGACEAETELDIYGNLKALNRDTVFSRVPDWYRWEREKVKEQIDNGEYLLDCKVKIMVFRDYRAIYDVGYGHLTHNKDGFKLIGNDGELNYSQPTNASYSLYADYYWYEIGDVICIGNNEMLYYCFPEESENVSVAKARLATEEMYKIAMQNRRRQKSDSTRTDSN